ncbi:MAG: AmmeMemoRadiSam system protein B [Actinomycetota bacterium]|nr:AmmeMemoRadiSam system protein B [Actinomycetota bacterium]
MNRYEKIRDSIVAGSFYSNDPYVLRLQIEDFLKNAENYNLKNIKAIICPHAGYIYSGQVAAFSYKQIEDKKYDSIIIIAPSHSEYFDFISIYDGDAYNTPLGKISIDKERCQQLADYDKNIKLSEHGHYNEHSIEVQLPFLQYIYDEFKFIPVVIGAQDKRNIECIGKAIGETFANQNILVVASTDLSHYHKYGEAVLLDKKVEELVSKFDIDNLENEFLNNDIEMCGGGPVVAAMIAAKKMGANKAVILKYQNSGDVSGERQAVVGYLSAAIFAENRNPLSADSDNGANSEEKTTNKDEANKLSSMELSDEQKKILLEIARKSIVSSVLKTDIELSPINDSALNEKCGAFVTLTLSGNLRGCIGNIKASIPLWETVKTMAAEAALNDPRFYPVNKNELDEIEIEISVLSPFLLINDIDRIEVGKHGLFIKKGFYQGLLLPQVATDYNWDKIEFLKQTCRKAGLAESCWKEKNCEIYIFSATIFNEEEFRK